MKVLKFGGSSVANVVNINRVIDIILDTHRQERDLVIVVSAAGGVTDRLIQLAGVAKNADAASQPLFEDLCTKHNEMVEGLIKPERKQAVLALAQQKYDELLHLVQGIALLKECSPQTVDAVMSIGEQLSAFIISEAIIDRETPCAFVDARSCIRTDSRFGHAAVQIDETYRLIATAFSGAKGLSVMGGFIASNEKGVTTTLGRGGSDYSASLVAAALNAPVVEIWTDVDGVLTADPRQVPSAFPLPAISYEEAGELAHFGAKVIHPKTMKPARLKGIPIHIKNTFHPEAPGTIINGAANRNEYLVTGVSSLRNIALIRVQSTNIKYIAEISSRIFEALSLEHIEVFLTTQASYEPSICIAVQTEQAPHVKRVLENVFELELQMERMSPITIQDHLSIIAVVGEQMRGVPGISGRVFHTLGAQGINVVAIAQGSSELNISAVIEMKDESRALNAIHDAFFFQSKKEINICLVGTGLIGGTLLRQIHETATLHHDRYHLRIRLIGVANEDRMAIDPKGIAIDQWNDALGRGADRSIEKFVSSITALGLPNTVFVDCTASEEIPVLYEDLLSHGIAVVTPNKKGNSGPLALYQALQETSRKYQQYFRYETNVGAALPVIHTLKSLLECGDEIVKIEAVLSGTLSYIFNTFFHSDQPFSDIVRDARNKGYTEPDPRDDLNGKDVARKILILAREAGLPMEIDQVQIDPFLPAACFAAPSIEIFFAELEKCNTDLQQQKQAAMAQNKKLCFVATLEHGKARIGLTAVDPTSALFGLRESDNIVMFTTKRYSNTPLVIQGPGAGAEVTAGGVLACIIQAFV